LGLEAGMSFIEGKILLCRLYERTSSKGNRYLAGRLGNAKIIAFLNTEAELRFGATGCIDVYVQSGEDRKADGECEDRGRSPRGSADRSGSSSTSSPSRIQSYQAPQAERPDPGRPFHDDDISDIGATR
jgi:hypothetical protein